MPVVGMAAESTTRSIRIKVSCRDMNGLVHDSIYNIGLNSPFQLIMDHWCHCTKIDSGSSAFLVQDRLVLAGDTPSSFFGRGIELWLLQPETVFPPPQMWAIALESVQAMREELERRVHHKRQADVLASVADAGNSDYGDEDEEGREEEETVESSSDEAAGGKSSPARGTLRFCVLAQTPHGNHHMFFNLASDVSMGRMMSAWCNHNKIHPDAAVFKIGRRKLDVLDTPQSLSAAGFLTRLLEGMRASHVEVQAVKLVKKRGTVKA